MNNFSNQEQILFLDIETVPQYPALDDCPEELKKLWSRKSENLRKSEGESPADIYNRAGIYAEFGRIVCVSCGYLKFKETTFELRIKSFSGEDEAALLNDFAGLLNSHYSKADSRLCAHNGKEFDFPYLARRMVINGIALPAILDTGGKKPWEVHFLDTMELWKFGDFKNYTPLNLLTYVLGIPSPKDDIDGSQVWSVFWHDRDIARIARYCEKDVEALANVYLKMKGMPAAVRIS
ncbi:MAG TPA: 3'-5' exonuclease [Bacteroidia bacterium]|nr:3'-5' exonuclease [Bacteroidia bacterium]